VGISFLETLLAFRNINFTAITLLAPGGTLNMQIQTPSQQLRAYSTNYTINELKNLMLDSRITLLDARMVSLENIILDMILVN
jgi:hypothetical protein